MEILVLSVLIVLFGLVFDYTNGFHDAANVVATVIATRVLAPMTASSSLCFKCFGSHSNKRGGSNCGKWDCAEHLY